MRYLLVLLALAGVVVSALALRVHYSTDTQPCSINEKWDCGIVNHSEYAEIRHVPVAGLGIAGYLALAALVLAGKRRILAILAVGALGFSLYLTYVEASILQVFCVYCVISLGIVTLLVVLTQVWAITGPPLRKRSKVQL